MGAQLRVYRQKIRSAQTTKKITRAMELISASRIQKAQARMAASTPYARAVTRAVSAVATYSNVDHVLTTEREQPKRAAVRPPGLQNPEKEVERHAPHAEIRNLHLRCENEQ